MNLYVYCGNSPANHTDPSGKFVWLVPVLGGAAFGGVSYLAMAAATGHCWSYGGLAGAMLNGAIAGAILEIGVAASPWAVGAVAGGVGSWAGSILQQWCDNNGNVNWSVAAQAGVYGVLFGGLLNGIGAWLGGGGFPSGGEWAPIGGGSLSNAPAVIVQQAGLSVIAGTQAGGNMALSQSNGGDDGSSSHDEQNAPKKTGTPKIDDLSKDEGKLKNAMKQGDPDAIYDAHRSNEGFQKRQNRRRIEERQFRNGDELEWEERE